MAETKIDKDQGNHAVNMDRIFGTIYLGGKSAVRTQYLRERNIRTVLTVMEKPVHQYKTFKNISYHWIKAYDMADEDLLSKFLEAFAIIDSAVISFTGILVHCAAGISRSATIVISYLMRKLRLPMSPTMEWVSAGRSIIRPNRGFLRQLSLWEEMGYTIDANNRQFRQYLQKQYICDDFVHLSRYFQRVYEAENVTINLVKGCYYVCNHCGCKLFNEIHVINNDCPLLIEPQTWMYDLYDDLPPGSTITCCQCPNTIAYLPMASNIKIRIMPNSVTRCVPSN